MVWILWMLACTTQKEIDSGDIVPASYTFVDIASDGLSVSVVEPSRYLGVWYEVASVNTGFQANCTGTKAEYSLIDQETIAVYNTCWLSSLDGEFNEIEGTATFQDASYARLMVDFNFGFTFPYNIVELDGSGGEEAYGFAAVSSYNTLWILSRESSMDDTLYEMLVQRLSQRGYPTENLRLTVQPE